MKFRLKYITLSLAFLAFFHLLYGTESAFFHIHGQALNKSKHPVVSIPADNEICLVCEIASLKLVEAKPERNLKCLFSISSVSTIYADNDLSHKEILFNSGRAPPVV